MSSLKMTFSLASLVLLMAFGLVFVTTPVMAHPERADDPLTTGTDETIGPHQHPTVRITATDADPNTAGTQVADEVADADNVQFTVTFTWSEAAAGFSTVTDLLRTATFDPAPTGATVGSK